jgi:hypothetical protein
MKRSSFTDRSPKPELLQECWVMSVPDGAPVYAYAPARCRPVFVRSTVSQSVVPAEEFVGGEFDLAHVMEKLFNVSGPATSVARRQGGAITPTNHDISSALVEFPKVPGPGVVAAELAIDPVDGLGRQPIDVLGAPVRPILEDVHRKIPDQFRQILRPIG